MTQAKKSILFVDDEPDISRLVIFRLKKEGYEVASTDNGKEALNLAASKPDLILLDLWLPDLDGFEICAKIKTNPDLKDIPIIFFTASAGEIEKLTAKIKHLGAQDVVIKPFNTEELLGKIKKYI